MDMEGGVRNPMTTKQKAIEIEKVAESLGVVALSIEEAGDGKLS